MKDINKVDEEKILHKINEITDEPKVPDCLLPKNIMKTIKDKEKAIKTEKKKKVKKIWHIGTGTVVVAATVLLSVTIFRTGMFNGHKCNEYTTYKEEAVKGNQNEYVYEEVVLSNDTSREVLVQYFLNRVYEKENNKQNYLSTGDYYGESQDIYYSNSKGMTDGALDGYGSYTTEYSENYNSTDESYYQNNDQVEGVVEADKVISDGKYIYSLSDYSSISIAKADKGELEYISEIEFKKDYEKLYEGRELGTNVKFYIHEDKLIVIFSTYIPDENMEDIYYCKNYNSSYMAEYNTCIMQYDLSNISKPKLSSHNAVDGSYISSRKVDKYLYLITDKYVDISLNDGEELEDGQQRVENECIPKVNNVEIPCKCIYIPEDLTNYNNYKVITAFEIGNDLELTDSAAFLSSDNLYWGDSEIEIYMSAENIYLYSRVFNSEGMSKELGPNEIQLLYSTKIWKYGYNDGDIEFKANTEFKGELLNQFSLDENNGYLRLVSNVTEYQAVPQNGDSTKVTGISMNETSAVYIFDENLNVCGSIEGIAENEEIYSARFMGDYGYFVTFERTDPLFVVDLSNPNNPVILDELKIPGFSEYLHMWDENLLFGVGKEADEAGNTLGFKIAMYDVTDKENIFEITKYVDEGLWASDSYDYKNMMVAPEKSLFGLSAYEEIYYEEKDDIGNIVVYGITNSKYNLYEYKDNEFNEVLSFEYENDYSMTWEYEDFEYRGLYIGDYLYVIVLDEGIQSFSLDNYEKVDFVEFE